MKDFIEMSKYAGMREDLVQAGGGNSAYKISPDRMAVKASGCQLADVTEDSGYAVVNPEVIREAFLNSADLDGMTEADSRRILEQAYIEGTRPSQPSRPSIETFLHAVSGRYSLHTHPAAVSILASRAGGMDVLKELFPDALMVPYATPGIGLAKAYFKKFRERGQRMPRAVFLQNHGFLASAETAGEAAAVTEETVKRIEDYLGMDMSGCHAVTELYNALCRGHGIIWRVTDCRVRQARKALGRVWDSAFCPDCVVFLGKRMYDAGSVLDAGKFEEFKAEYGEPAVIAYKDDLYIHAPSVRKALEVQSVLGFSAQVMLGNAGQECRMLPDEEQDFLLGWDAEKYRRNME